MIIRHTVTNNIIYSCDAPTMLETVEEAVKKDTNLSYADLNSAKLKGINLKKAFLSQVTLRNTDLRDADLSNAYLDSAYLNGTNLSGATLNGVYLFGIDLRSTVLKGAMLDGEELVLAPISILNLRWNVLITGEYMTIGCERHTHQEWTEFTEDRIKAMHPEAFEFWFGNWRIPLLNMCEAHRNACELRKAEISSGFKTIHY